MLDLTIATWDYDRIRPVLDGRVELSGCNLNYIILPPEECFYRAYILKEFEISEISEINLNKKSSKEIATATIQIL